jgi:acylphosphatase
MTSREGRSRRRVLYSGHVQGVGFRYQTLHVAHDFAVDGFVRNLADGRVELVVEGETSELDRFLASVHAEMEDFIADVQVERSLANGEFRGFEVRV